MGGNEAVQWWFRTAIVLFACLATIMIDVKPVSRGFCACYSNGFEQIANDAMPTIFATEMRPTDIRDLRRAGYLVQTRHSQRFFKRPEVAIRT
jgi:hypothetical protein